MGLFRGALLFALAIAPVAMEFNRFHAGVVFVPSVFIKDDTAANLVKELVPPLSKISTKFTKISFRFEDHEATTTAGSILAAVESFNKDYQTGNTTPLEVTILLMETNYLKKYLNDTASILDIITKIADDGNKIYPGTVKKFFIEHYDFTLEPEDKDIYEFEAYLANVKFVRSKYELGASLPLSYCKDDGLPQVLKHFKHITFSYWPTVKNAWETSSRLNPISAFEELSIQFEECRQIIKEYGMQTQIQIETGWHCSWFTYPEPDGVHHDTNLVEFWERVNNWAVQVNITVVFEKAFDNLNPTHGTVWEHNGWWKLIENPVTGSNLSEKYVFVEKRNKIVNGNNLSFGSFWGIWLAVFIVCAVAITFTILFKRCSKYKNVEIQARLQFKLENFPNEDE